MEAVHQLRHLYRGQHDRGIGGGHMEGRVLSFVGRRPGATQSEVVAYCARDKGQVARLIGGLRERGLIEARPDADDRRIQRLYLTDAGRESQAVVQQRRARVARLAVEDLDDEERQNLLELLGRIRTRLEAVA
jgi:DNA-binding MarR family transcriptional regulator